VKHWLTLIIFSTQHHEETWHTWLQFCPTHLNTVASTCYTTMWNAYVIVWPFTTMNSYSVAHAGSEIVRQQNHWKSVTYLTLIRSESIIPRSRTSTTEMMYQQQVGQSESHDYWICYWRVSSASTHLSSWLEVDILTFGHTL